MTSVTIQLPAEIERHLREAASLAGKSVESYLQELAVRVARQGIGTGGFASVPEKPAEEWIAEWRAWVESHPARTVLADDSRESIYEGRGE